MAVSCVPGHLTSGTHAHGESQDAGADDQQNRVTKLQQDKDQLTAQVADLSDGMSKTEEYAKDLEVENDRLKQENREMKTRIQTLLDRFVGRQGSQDSVDEGSDFVSAPSVPAPPGLTVNQRDTLFAVVKMAFGALHKQNRELEELDEEGCCAAFKVFDDAMKNAELVRKSPDVGGKLKSLWEEMRQKVYDDPMD